MKVTKHDVASMALGIAFVFGIAYAWFVLPAKWQRIQDKHNSEELLRRLG